MIVIRNTIVSEDVFEKNFVCNLEKCKGACCVVGDAGAPLDEEEVGIIENLLPKIKPFMTPAYVEAIEQRGFYETDRDGDLVTTCQPTGECNFVVYDGTGTTQCAIENAYKAGAIDYKKPISCHLYPVRIKQYKEFTAVNYHKFDLCKAACSFGDELKVPVYKFLKEALTRKFGEDWYAELEANAE